MNKSELNKKARSYGAPEGSARGPRNIRLRLERIEKIVKIEGGRLLEVGCGNGAYTRVIAKKFARVDAIDVEENRLMYFKKHCKERNINIHEMSADELIFEESTFDAITAIEVIEHVSILKLVLKELNRVLKIDGWLAITTPNRLWPLEQHGYILRGKRYPGWLVPGLIWIPQLHRKYSDADAFTLGRLKRLLLDAGFTVIGHKYMFPPLDRFKKENILHRMMVGLERSPIKHFAQTIIIVCKKNK